MRWRVGILGATGAVGQRMIEHLADHPWFTIAELAASERSTGKPYREAVRWTLDGSVPDAVANLIVKPCAPPPSQGDSVRRPSAAPAWRRTPRRSAWP